MMRMSLSMSMWHSYCWSVALSIVLRLTGESDREVWRLILLLAADAVEEVGSKAPSSP